MAVIREAELYNERMVKCGIMDPVWEEPTIPYPFKYKNIPIMQDYSNPLGDEYWDNWGKNEYDNSLRNWISWERLNEEIKDSGYTNMDKVNRVREILVKGATLGCVGTGRLSSSEPNCRTVAEDGAKVADQLHDWVKSGIVFGPFRREEMPFEEYKVSPMSVRPKPGGKIRLIVDLSSPHGVPSDSDLPNSVNNGIDPSKLKTKMSSITQVCERIWRTGYPAEFVKIDWVSAYKHITIQHEDRKLQVVEFCGRLFIESQMTFGSRSSPDRFDVVSDIPLEIALKRSNLGRDDVAKQLDDVIGFGLVGTGVAGEFYRNYRTVCGNVGIQLAGEEDEEKAFGPSRVGVVLGLVFDLVRLEWSIPTKKADRILALLWSVKMNQVAQWKQWESLAGKITHYCRVVPFGKWERSWILNALTTNRGKRFRVEGVLLEQINWWIASIQMARVGSRIPDPRVFTPRIYLSQFPDASGGKCSDKAGLGSWFQTEVNQAWIQMPWPELIRDDKPSSLGVKFANKLTTLEAAAALMGMCSEPDLIRNKRLIIFSDNSGFVFAFAKGHSKCPYAHSVCKAVHYVGWALNCSVSVEKVPRRSSLGAIIADDLSKGLVESARERMGDPSPCMSRPSTVLYNWLCDPVPTRTLGEKIADELSGFTPVLDWGNH